MGGGVRSVSGESVGEEWTEWGQFSGRMFYVGSIISTKSKKQEDRSVCFSELKLRSGSVTPLVHSSGRLSCVHSAGPTDKGTARGTQA